MKEKNKRIVRRWMSTVLIIAMLFACVINDISLPYVSWAGEKASASDAIRNSRVTLKNRKAEKDDKVQIFVLSDQQDYQPGDTVCLELYIKNNTDEIISEGLLRYKAKGIEEDSAYFEDLNDLYTKISEAEEKAAEAEAAAKESKEEETESEAQETESEAQTEESQEQAEESSPVDESDEAEPNSTEETTEAEDESSQDAEEPLQTGEPETTAEEEIKEDSKVSDGLSEGDILDNEAEDTDENEEEEDDPTRLTDIEIEPGKAYYVNFYYTIDPEIEKIKDQNVEFNFSWADDDALIIKRPSVTEKFQYTVDGLNLLPVAVGGEKKWVQIGEEDEMILEFDLGRIEEILEEAEMEELEKNPDATISSARRSSASNALIGWDAEDDGKLKGKDDPAVVRNLKLDVETFDLKLNDFEVVPVDEKTDDNFGTTVACKFKVSRVNEPGTYYGKVNASYKIKNKTYYTSQAFRVTVKPEEGEMELTGKIGKSEIVMYGDVSAFPKADELSLKISEVTKEQQEKVEEALRKKSEEEGVEIKEYKALDIKLIADGVETEPEGDVKVRFKNVKAEEPEKDEEEAAEEVQPENQSIIKRFFSRMRTAFRADDEAEPMNIAVDDEIKADADKVEANGADKIEAETDKADEVKEDEKTGTAAEDGKSEADSSKSIKVLHLDEENIVTEEMTSEVLENGDIVMDTTHFSIYIVVNVPDVSSVIAEVYHYADMKQWEMEDDEKKLVKMYPGDGEYYYVDSNGNYYRDESGKIDQTKKVPVGKKLRLAETGKTTPETVKIGNNSTQRDVLYPGAAHPSADKEKNKYDFVETEIYSHDTYEMPNGAGTGIDYTLAVEKLSKVSSLGRYNVKKVVVKKVVTEVVKNENGEGTHEETREETIADLTENGTEQKVDLEAGINRIYIYYTPTEEHVKGPVGFHDYNVSIEKAGGTLKTKQVGMNNPVLPKEDANDTTQKTDKRIGIGIANGTDPQNNVFNTYLPHHVGGLDLLFSHNNAGKNGTVSNNTTRRYGIAEKNINDGNDKRSFKVNSDEISVDPGLFVPDDILVDETYKDGSTVKYYAKEYIDEYQLEFLRNGDNYVLTAVYDQKDRKATTQPLNRLIYTGNNWTAKNPMYTNLFWPMDEVQRGDDPSIFKGIPGKTRDYMLGGAEKHGVDATNDENGLTGQTIAHNWFFGMNCELKFKIGDYIGPMNYYFRGDDDLWLYVDGILVEDVDLGGTHQAVPAYVDLRKWMKDRSDIDQNLNAEHVMSIYFMERGGTGSCCYMAFTLPNVEIVPQNNPDSEVVSKSVKKNWLDGEDSLSRPSSVSVQLYQQARAEEGKPQNPKRKYGIAVPLNENNGWSNTWTDLPKFSFNVNKNIEYIYTVEEVSPHEDYIAFTDQGNDDESEDQNGDSSGVTESVLPETIITNVRKTDIPVKKEWIGDENDKDNCRPEKISVQLYKKCIPDSDTSRTVVPGDVSEWGEPIDTQELSNNNNWQYIWKGLPLYEFDEEEKVWKKVLYNVKEVDAEWLKTSATAEKGWYTASYDGNMTDGYIIKNTYETTTHSVTKIWDDNNNTNGLRPETIILQLQINDTGKTEDADADYRDYGERFTLSKVEHEDTNTIETGEESWKYTWTDLPQYTIQKNPDGTITQILNRYRVVEVLEYKNHEYYNPKYGPKGEDGTVITNKLDIHELPETGGPGTFWYTFGGLVLMAFALMYNILRRRKVLI